MLIFSSYNVIHSRKSFKDLLEVMRQGGKAVHVDQAVDTQKHTPSESPMQKKNYPKIDYWYYKQYTEESNRRDEDAGGNRKEGRGRSSDGKNVMFWFLQDETGRVLESIEVDSIREASRYIWRMLYEDYEGKLPCPWRKVDSRAQSRFYEEIEDQYPILKLCDGHWKARSICTNGYSQWYKTHTSSKKKTSIKCDSETTLPDNQPICPAKRTSETPPPAESEPNKKARGKSSKNTTY